MQNESNMRRLVTARRQRFFSLRKSDAEAAVWNKLDTERVKIGMSARYSSVFGERWITSLGKPKPVSVASRDALPGAAYDDTDVNDHAS